MSVSENEASASAKTRRRPGPPLSPRVWVVCRACGHSREYLTSRARTLTSHDATTGTFLCSRCTKQNVPRLPRLERPCNNCRRPVRYLPSRPRKYCNQVCAKAHRWRLQVSKRPLAQFIYARWGDSDLMLSPYARQIGLSPTCLRNVLRGHNPAQKTLDVLRATFGDALPSVVPDNDRRRAAADRARQFLPAPGSPAHRANARKGGLARNRQPRSPEQYRKMMATQTATGHVERSAVRFRALARTQWRRARTSLGAYLRWHPEASLAELREHATNAAPQFGMSAAGIWAEWQPLLRKYGLLDRGGHPPNEGRHQLIEGLKRDWPRTPTGKVKAGFWPGAARQVTEAERAEAQGQGKDPDEVKGWTSHGLQEWYRRHTQEPGRCKLAT
jgi:hypothetical protein